MAEFEFEFNQQDRELVVTQDNGTFGEMNYIRLTIYPTEGLSNIVTLPNTDEQAIFYSSLNDDAFDINISPFGAGLDELRLKSIGGNNNDFKIYRNETTNDIYIKPNEIFNEFELPQGNYRIQIDFLNQVKPNTGHYQFVIKQVSTSRKEIRLKLLDKNILSNSDDIINLTNEFNFNQPEIFVYNTTPEYLVTLPFPIDPSISLYDTNGDGIVDDNDIQEWTELYNRPDIADYLFRKFNNLPLEDSIYTFPSSFMDDVESGEWPLTDTDPINPNNNIDVYYNLTEENTPNPNYKYQFKHVVNIGTGDHIPIMNYQFDSITDGFDNQSIILKLYDSLPADVSNLSMVTIEREVLTTQLQDIFYFSDVPDVFFGDGLIPQPQEDWISSNNNNVQFENYDEISSSIDDTTLDNLVSQSQYNYPNLNTDFNEFSNHTFFGSAKKKLENFKTKVETIQGYYSEISSSLIVSCSVDSDSTFIVQKRKDLFRKINNEIKTFTPYERFLYYDGQSESTSSVPGLGQNYVASTPVTQEEHTGEGITLNGHDGFSVVYKHSDHVLVATNDGDEVGDDIDSGHVDLFKNKYNVHKAPFFNHSGSIFLSFLLKGDEGINLRGPLINPNGQQTNQGNNEESVKLPIGVVSSADIINPAVTGSEYRRYIFRMSQSYWAPTSAVNFDIGQITDFSATSTQYEILSGSAKTSSNAIKDFTGKYPISVVTQSGVTFTGSCMPAGELFRLNYLASDASGSAAAVTSSLMTNITITFNDPTDVLPFDNIVHTGSSTWDDWYNGAIDSASAFDTDNIHSFENNLPLYIQESSEFNDMKDFLNLQGEQYDLIRNHIDSMGTIHKRGYKKTDSPPTNVLPILLSNMGWEAINPFSGSLSETLGNYLTNITSIDDIKNNTWRKTLNNLIYIYKSKGTKNSVRALLNTYGYPPDILEFEEFGGSTEESNPRIFVNDPPSGTATDLSLDKQSGSFSFTSKKEKLYRYNFIGNENRILNLDWWMDDANINTIEFVYKHTDTTNTQTILESSGSGNETLWDLTLIPSTDGLSSSFKFRLNDSNTGSLAIATNAVSMSTAFSDMTDGQLWNVMLQRMTSSISGAGTQEYRLHTSLQDGKDIETYNYVTMSVIGDTSPTGSNHIANRNFISSGSRHYLSSSNLFVGEILSGSLSQIKAWSTTLSTSKFRQHTLNKFSTVGNTINSHKDELVYHFKLNENYASSSISSSTQDINIVDAAPKTTLTTDYSFEADGNIFNTSSVYGFDFIEVVKLNLQDNISKVNDNNILINPRKNVVGDLSPIQSATKRLEVENSKPLFKTSPKLELYRSPQTFVDNFILDKLSGYNFETLYGNPKTYYSQSYDEFDTFREGFFDAHPITVDTNKFIRAHESMFNDSISEGIKSIIPARSTFSDRNSNFGVEIRPTILEKQKYENEPHSVETNPNTATGSIGVLSVRESILSSSGTIKRFTDTTGINLTGSKFELPKSGSISVLSVESVMTGSKLELPYSASIGRGYIPKDFTSSDTSSLSPITSGSSIVLPKSGSINIRSIKKTILSGSGQVQRFDDTIGLNLTGSIIDFPKSGTIDYASDANKSFENIHDSWGTGANDTYFINYYDTGSDGEYNTYTIDTRFNFIAIGDTEIYSGSAASGSFDFSDFSNSSKFFNRTLITEGVHGSITYESLINGSPGNQTGRMIGKTRYFLTGSDGTITFPRNHVSRFIDEFKVKAYSGTQNVNPGILNVRYEDYSTASFYRVKVTGGENQIRVQTGPSDLGSDDKIMYG